MEKINRYVELVNFAWKMEKILDVFEDYELEKNLFSNGGTILIKKNGFQFKLTKLNDPKDANRLQYFWEVVDRIPNAQSILFGFCRKQKPDFNKILQHYPNASKVLYKEIDVEKLETVTDFLDNIGNIEKSLSNKQSIKEREEREAIEKFNAPIKRRLDLVSTIQKRSTEGQPIVINQHTEATALYDTFIRDNSYSIPIKKPKCWASDSQELYDWANKLTFINGNLKLIKQ